MEIAGVAVGIAGLAGLFSACMDALDKYDSYKNAGLDARYLTTRFEAHRLLFQNWGDAVGVSNGKLKGEPDIPKGHLDIVARMLSIIRNVFEVTEGTLSDAQLQLCDENLPPDYIKHSSRARLTSTKAKLKWALRGKSGFEKQVEMLEVLVRCLYDLLPPRISRKDSGLSSMQKCGEEKNAMSGNLLSFPVQGQPR